MSNSVNYKGRFVFDPADDRFKKDSEDGLPCVVAYDDDKLNRVFTVSNRPASDPTIPGYPNYAGSKNSVVLHEGKGTVQSHILSLTNQGAILGTGVRITFHQMSRRIRFTGLFSRGSIRLFTPDNEIGHRELREGETALDETVSNEKGIKPIHFDFKEDASLYLFELEMLD